MCPSPSINLRKKVWKEREDQLIASRKMYDFSERKEPKNRARAIRNQMRQKRNRGARARWRWARGANHRAKAKRCAQRAAPRQRIVRVINARAICHWALRDASVRCRAMVRCLLQAFLMGLRLSCSRARHRARRRTWCVHNHNPLWHMLHRAAEIGFPGKRIPPDDLGPAGA